MQRRVSDTVLGENGIFTLGSNATNASYTTPSTTAGGDERSPLLPDDHPLRAVIFALVVLGIIVGILGGIWICGEAQGQRFRQRRMTESERPAVSAPAEPSVNDARSFRAWWKAAEVFSRPTNKRPTDIEMQRSHPSYIRSRFAEVLRNTDGTARGPQSYPLMTASHATETSQIHSLYTPGPLPGSRSSIGPETYGYQWPTRSNWPPAYSFRQGAILPHVRGPAIPDPAVLPAYSPRRGPRVPAHDPPPAYGHHVNDELCYPWYDRRG